MSPAIESEKDRESNSIPDPKLPWRYEHLQSLLKIFKGERTIIMGVTDIFALGRENILGDVGYFRAMVKNPSLIDRTHEPILEYQMRYMKNFEEAGADIFWVNGDRATTEKPMAWRDFFRNGSFPLC